MKTLKVWLSNGLSALCVACACLPQWSLAQAPIVLSSADAPLVFELPLDASTVQSLTATTAVQLATRAQHDAQGMVYPDWLSDATFNVNNRPRQRLAIVVTAKRGNTELATELLLTLNNAGRRSFKPMHLIFDKVSTFAGTPLAAPSTTELPASAAENKTEANAAQTPIIRFEGAPASAQKPPSAVALPVPDRATAPSPPKSSGNVAATKPRVANPKAAVLNAPSAPPSALSASSANAGAPLAFTPSPAPPVTSASAPTLPVSSPASNLPTRTARPPIVAPAPDSGWTSWLSHWPELLGGLVLLLALLYLTKRLLQKWRERRRDQVETAFIDPSPTILSPEEAGTNTVFGLSEEEANAMHAKWLREQTTKRSS